MQPGATIRPVMDLKDLDPAMRLAISVIKRCVAGEGVELEQKTLRDWNPTAHLCHDNVREWVKLYPKYTHVYGFFVADRRPISNGTLVIPHSAVGGPDGSLNDITPSELDVRYPFVPHTGTPEEFELIAAAEPFTIEVPHRLLFKFLKQAP
jgi:hypothetical protein